ncbi:MAG TPA: pteridine reductase [Nevskiaceae bacterium]|nr:pteridine reductase [Nevskiaceae bacterium]
MNPDAPVVLVTGAAKRIGAAIARTLHAGGARVVLHYRSSRGEAQPLARALEAARPDSSALVAADLLDLGAIDRLAQTAHARWGRLDALVNNASSYFATDLATLTGAQFDDLVGTNLKAPLFLSRACAPLLADGGCIVNIIDIHARKPLKGFAPYLAAKAGLWTLTEALALELAPRVRVNGVAPGHMLWAADPQFSPERADAELRRVPMGRLGGEQEIARAVRFLLSSEAAYINGAVLPVDGGLRLA